MHFRDRMPFLMTIPSGVWFCVVSCEVCRRLGIVHRNCIHYRSGTSVGSTRIPRYELLTVTTNAGYKPTGQIIEKRSVHQLDF
jgi:hypothetical protein